MLSKFFNYLWDNAYQGNNNNIISLLEHNPKAKFLDLGCSDGTWTTECAKKMGTKQVYGVEVVDELISQAQSKGITVEKGDLNKFIPFEDNAFDVMHANQVIEHLYDTEHFMLEINRLCKMGGVIVLSTENASSWHNLFALMLGWQMFSLTNICSTKAGMGNPLAIHRGNNISYQSMQHIRIFAYRGLIEYIEHFGFKVERILCSGYYPLPNWFAKIDPRHGHFITIKARKIR
ncbi:MAG TPA: class I SAM-dependent methyltransferase [Thiotrichaceae bacterium]|nr:class I SAM-dependent methyltransferase [Thiotrichaceae bacterium]